MGASASGALNASGFSQAIKSKQLPKFDHITHNGIFNQNFFQVGDKAKSLLQIYHGVGISNCNLYDISNRNYFLSMFLKSSTDGQKRTRPLNVVVCLDVSGSMNGPLKYQAYEGPKLNRLDLSRKAIMMLFEKLQDNDVFSLVTFHFTAKTIIKSTFVKDLNRDAVRQSIYSKFQTGGTTIRQGFNQSLKNIETFKQENTLTNYQNRIVMLTDVGDNSVANQNILIDQISSAKGINTTIIGVSTDFRSQTCQKLIQVKGFNYFCAVQDSDLQTYLADRFDYNFFPCVQNTQISIESDQIQSIEVYGSVDYKTKYEKIGNKLIVTKMKSGFPSQLQKNKQGKLETQGGLILVKFTPKVEKQLPVIQLKIKLSYEDMEGKSYNQQYQVNQKIEAEEFYSDEALKKGVKLFYYTQTMRNLLRDMGEEGEKKLKDQNKGLYLQKLEKLKEYSPQSKKQELQKVMKIVEDINAKPAIQAM